MLDPVNLFDLPRYTSLIATGILLSLVWLVYHLRGTYRTAQIVDVCLAGIIGGIVLARAGHVWLDWRYFQDHTAEIVQLRAGGLNWHGAVIGALLAMGVMARIRRVDFRRLLVPLAFVLPVMVVFGWWGCYAAQCAYGAEVANLSDHPAWLVAESRDIFNTIAPRYRTQQIGMGLGVGLVLLALVSHRFVPPARRHAVFWLILALLGAGMGVISGLRGDYAAPHLARLLDIAIILLGIGGLMRFRTAPSAPD